LPKPHGGARLKTRPSDKRGGARPGSGPPKRIRKLSLAESDARAIEDAAGLDLLDALRRIAASAAADRDGTRAQLAPLLAIEAWDGIELL